LLPDFVVIGAPRSGTTWLYKQLSLHPGVFLPKDNKEPRFFAVREGESPVFTGPGDDVWSSGLVANRADYEQLFATAGDRCKGEASTDYLYRGSVAASTMRELVPSVRIVAILRNPVERAYSAWRFLTHSGHETASFEAGLAAEPQRIADGYAWWWHYTRHGFYARNLQPYLETFPREQILLLSYDDLVESPQAFLDTVTEFIGVEPLRGEDLGERVNEAPLTRAVRRSARGTLLARAVPASARGRARAALDRLTLYKPPVGDESSSKLTALYRPDLEQLEELTGRRFDLRR
jgi:hypothetical protein